ncbi:hypothetical protein GPALN_015009 [Globodera pallida]|nr:hypothetical protein GPALN_015009 [Globodera pallida]
MSNSPTFDSMVCPRSVPGFADLHHRLFSRFAFLCSLLTFAALRTDLPKFRSPFLYQNLAQSILFLERFGVESGILKFHGSFGGGNLVGSKPKDMPVSATPSNPPRPAPDLPTAQPSDLSSVTIGDPGRDIDDSCNFTTGDKGEGRKIGKNWSQ